MKHRIALTGLMIALASSAAHAQYIENFATPKLGPAWSFILPGQNPGYPAGLGNTEDVTHYSISNNTFTVTQQGGGITYGHNIPTVTIGSGATGNYDIRLTVNAPFNYPGQTVYPSAGLLIATDASNYLTFGTKSAGGNNNYPNVYLASAGSPVGGQYDNLTSYQNVGAGPVVYHINKTGTTISFSYIAVGSTTEAPLGTVTAADTDTFKAAAYALLSNLGGKHIGPYSDNFSNTITDTVSFSSFSTSLPVVLPKTTDNFFGPKLNPTWSFFLPGGWQGQGGSDEDASAYKVANGVFAVQATNGGLYGPGNYIRNLPLATVQANAPGDYVIETAVDATFNYPNVAEVYPDWGILVGDDTSNYFFIGTKHSGYTNNNTTAPANYNYPNTYLKIGNNNIGNYDNFQDYSGTGIGPILYRIRKVGTTITFSATRAGDVEKIMGTASASDDPTSYAGQVYTYLKNVSGKRIILAANPGFNSAINDTVAFSRFYTSLPLVQPLQFADELSGSALSGAWSFNVTGNNPVNTEDPTAYNVANGAFNVTLKGNNFPNAVNVPSVTVGTGNASDWWIETAVKVSFDAVNGYPIAMLTVFDDANNFFEYGIKHNSYNGANYNDATSLLSIGGTFTDDLLTDYAGVGTSDNAVFRIVKSAGTITLSFLDANNNEHVTGTLDSSATGAKKDAYTLLSNINGKHIGFVTSQNGSGATDTASFDYLRSSLNILQPAATTGRIALEGVMNLSSVPAAVGIGTFHIEFRTPGTTTVIKSFDVTLTPVGTTAFGTYSIPNAPSGTYDVAIKGSKQLRVVLPNVTVGSGTVLADVTLPSGDATNDNIVDIGDFGVLVNAYGGDVTITGSGYDTRSDFDYNGVIDIGDFGILVNEYGNMGAN